MQRQHELTKSITSFFQNFKAYAKKCVQSTKCRIQLYRDLLLQPDLLLSDRLSPLELAVSFSGKYWSDQVMSSVIIKYSELLRKISYDIVWSCFQYLNAYWKDGQNDRWAQWLFYHCHGKTSTFFQSSFFQLISSLQSTSQWPPEKAYVSFLMKFLIVTVLKYMHFWQDYTQALSLYKPRYGFTTKVNKQVNKSMESINRGILVSLEN